MPTLSFVTLDVFTTTRFAGNPLAVVLIPPDHPVSTDQMQTIAREFNLSETIFLHERRARNDAIPDWRVRIFLTTAEVPFAGHPTIGAAWLALRKLAAAASPAPSTPPAAGRLQCNAGAIDIRLVAADVAAALVPHNIRVHAQHPLSPTDIAALQPRLQSAAVLAVDTVSTVQGMTFVCVELPDLSALASVEVSGVVPRPRLDDDWPAQGFVAAYFYVVVSGLVEGQDGVPWVGLRTRMVEGAMEDPATGSAACGLCAFLALKWARERTVRFEVRQGVEMRRCSDIGVVVTLCETLTAVDKIELVGAAVKVMEGSVEYD